MNGILFILAMLTGVVQQVARKEFNKRNSGGVYSFSAAAACFVLAFFLVTSKGSLHFTGQTIWYALAFALAYAITTITTMLAIQCGPLSLISLIISYSTVIPTVYGFVFLNEPVSFKLILGIVFLLVSLFFINQEGSAQKTITFRWIVFALITFFGNGACSTVQKVFQLKSGGSAESEFMIFAMCIVVGILALMAVITEKKECGKNLKEGFVWYGICGLGNGITNFLVMLLALSVPASVMYPLLSAGGIVVTILVSMLLYREKLSAMQKIGFVLGIAATVLLS